MSSNNPMSMMMGMMGNPMGMMSMGMPGMPRGMPGMPSMMGLPGMPPMPGMPPLAEGDKKLKRRARKSHNDGSSRDNSEARSAGRHSRGRGRGRHRVQKEEPIEEVEKFLEDNKINEEAATKIRALSPDSQRRIISRPLTGDVQNPSKVMIARVRELQSQNEKMKGGSADMWSAWNNAMMGASPEAVQKYLDDNDLDESASRQMRSLPPHLQATALQWDLSSFRNPSAKFMSMANGLSVARAPGMPVMPGMPSMPFGWPMGGMAPPGMPPMGMPMHGMTPTAALGSLDLDDF